MQFRELLLVDAALELVSLLRHGASSDVRLLTPIVARPNAPKRAARRGDMMARDVRGVGSIWMLASPSRSRIPLEIWCVTSPECRLDGRMFRVPLGRLLVRVTDAAQHRFAQPATNELHAQRQAVRRETARHRQGWAAAEVERLGVNVIPDLTAPRCFGLFVERILPPSRVPCSPSTDTPDNRRCSACARVTRRLLIEPSRPPPAPRE